MLWVRGAMFVIAAGVYIALFRARWSWWSSSERVYMGALLSVTLVVLLYGVVKELRGRIKT